MHGNGNDFIIVENLTNAHSLSKSQIVKIGDRKKGLGFDQLITINPPKNSNHMNSNRPECKSHAFQTTGTKDRQPLRLTVQVDQSTEEKKPYTK